MELMAIKYSLKVFDEMVDTLHKPFTGMLYVALS